MYVANGNAGGQAGFNGTAGPDGCRRLVIDKKPISPVYARAIVMRFTTSIASPVRFTTRRFNGSSHPLRHRHCEIGLLGLSVRKINGWARRRRCRRAVPCRPELY